MNDKEADAFLRDNEWSSWDDARELVKKAAMRGTMKERLTCVSIVRLWSERHKPDGTVNARNAATELVTAIQGPWSF